MKHYTKLLFVLAVVVLSACGVSKEDAIKYNDVIVQHIDKVDSKLSEYYDAYGSAETSKMEAARAALLSTAEEAKKSVEGMDRIPNADGMTDAAVEYFNFMIEQCNGDIKYTCEKNDASLKDNALFDELSSMFDKLGNRSDEILSKFDTEQQKTAEAYGYQIESGE